MLVSTVVQSKHKAACSFFGFFQSDYFGFQLAQRAKQGHSILPWAERKNSRQIRSFAGSLNLFNILSMYSFVLARLTILFT